MLKTVLPREELKRQEVLSECGTVPIVLAFFSFVPRNWSSNDHRAPKGEKRNNHVGSITSASHLIQSSVEIM